MDMDTSEFQLPQQDELNGSSERGEFSRMSPARRAGLDALEREFSELMKLNRNVDNSDALSI